MENNETKQAAPPEIGGHFNRAVLSLLRSGGEWSAAEITLRLMVSDPRGIIRELRRKGYRIADRWQKGVYGGRYKRYRLIVPDEVAQQNEL